MNSTNDFISLLLNNREKIVDKLSQNYSYDYLLKIFSEINNGKNELFKIEPNDKHVYRYLTGLFKNSSYDKSSINWIPSMELVDSLLLLAKSFGIEYIEEIYAGLGILSGLLRKRSQYLNITSSDTFENPETCNQLGFSQIARRSPNDFKYYKQLNELYPQMIISSYYPSHKTDQSMIFIEELSNLIQSKNHSIILIILPNTFTLMYDILYHILMDNEYDYFSYHVKAIDKYFFLTNLMNKQYVTGTLIHILIKKEIISKCNIPIDSILKNAIIPSKYIDTHCSQTKWFKFFYDKLSTKLVKSFYRSCNFKNHLVNNDKMKKIIDNITLIDKLRVTIPSYIYDSDEFLFWSNCISRRLYFVFKDRQQFYNFYVEAKSIDNSGIRRNISFPSWTYTNDWKYIYLYFEIILPGGNWKTNRNIFRRIWIRTSEENIKLLQLG